MTPVAVAQRPILRWILMLPGALLVAVLSTFPLHWILEGIFSGDEGSFVSFVFGRSVGPMAKTVELNATPFFMAVTFVWTGSEIAPTHKKLIAILLALLWLAILGFLFLWLGNRAVFGINTIGSVLGAVGGIFLVRRIVARMDNREK
jgi:hypothetical protein